MPLVFSLPIVFLGYETQIIQKAGAGARLAVYL